MSDTASLRGLDFQVTAAMKEQLLTRGFVSFDLPEALVDSKATQQLQIIDAFLADREPGALVVELAKESETKVEDGRVVAGLIAERGLQRAAGEGQGDAMFEISGRYSQLEELKEAVLREGIALRQMWYFRDIEPARESPEIEPLTDLLLGLFEQFYGELTEQQRKLVVSDSNSRFQLYTRGCFIEEHQDGVEYSTRDRRGDVVKSCIMLCYLNKDWHEGFGGEIACAFGPDGQEQQKLAPTFGRIAILDFTKFNNPHTVFEVVDGDFVRKMIGRDFRWRGTEENAA